jgi:hypothetical protein
VSLLQFSQLGRLHESLSRLWNRTETLAESLAQRLSLGEALAGSLAQIPNSGEISAASLVQLANLEYQASHLVHLSQTPVLVEDLTRRMYWRAALIHW